MNYTRLLAVSMGGLLGLAFAEEEKTTNSWLYLAPGLMQTVTDGGVVISGWYDAEKTWDEDDNMCYAASAANLIAWWQNSDSAVVSEAPRSLDVIW